MDPYHHQSMHDSRSLSFPIQPPPLIYHASLGEGRRGGGRRRPGAKLSTDPQSVAARERRHRISDRFRVLRSLVPGGSKMDTVSMLEQAIHYVKFLKAQVSLHQAALMQHEEASGHVFSGAASATSANDEVVQLPVPVEEAVGYGQVQGLLDHPGQISSSHELPPLPSCLFVEEPAAACYSVRSLHDEETDVHGSY